MAATDATNGEPAAPERAVRLDGLHRVGGAGRGVAAGGGLPGEEGLVAVDQRAQDPRREPEARPVGGHPRVESGHGRVRADGGLIVASLSNACSRSCVNCSNVLVKASGRTVRRYAPGATGEGFRAASWAIAARSRRRIRLRSTAGPNRRVIAKA